MKVQSAAYGAEPPLANGEVQAAAWIQRMFGRIAPRYDLLNHLLSFNIDRRWRRLLLQSVEPMLQRGDAVVLDLCCGTADVLLELQKKSSAQIVGVDFSHPMLVEARRKLQALHLKNPLIEADALCLPFAKNTLDGITISFGFRNLASYQAGLAELYRVLKPAGRLAILEFSHPPNPIVRFFYSLYSRYVLPFIGGIVSGSREAYTYLPESIAKFPAAPALLQQMEQAGLVNTQFRLLTGGIAALHTGTKPTR